MKNENPAENPIEDPRKRNMGSFPFLFFMVFVEKSWNLVSFLWRKKITVIILLVSNGMSLYFSPHLWDSPTDPLKLLNVTEQLSASYHVCINHTQCASGFCFGNVEGPDGIEEENGGICKPQGGFPDGYRCHSDSDCLRRRCTRSPGVNPSVCSPFEYSVAFVGLGSLYKTIEGKRSFIDHFSAIARGKSFELENAGVQQGHRTVIRPHFLNYDDVKNQNGAFSAVVILIPFTNRFQDALIGRKRSKILDIFRNYVEKEIFLLLVPGSGRSTETSGYTSMFNSEMEDGIEIEENRLSILDVRAVGTTEDGGTIREVHTEKKELEYWMGNLLSVLHPGPLIHLKDKTLNDVFFQCSVDSDCISGLCRNSGLNGHLCMPKAGFPCGYVNSRSDC